MDALADPAPSPPSPARSTDRAPAAAGKRRFGTPMASRVAGTRRVRRGCLAPTPEELIAAVKRLAALERSSVRSATAQKQARDDVEGLTARVLLSEPTDGLSALLFVAVLIDKIGYYADIARGDGDPRSAETLDLLERFTRGLVPYLGAADPDLLERLDEEMDLLRGGLTARELRAARELARVQ